MEDPFSKEIAISLARFARHSASLLLEENPARKDIYQEAKEGFVRDLYSNSRTLKFLMTEAERDDKGLNTKRLTQISYDLEDYANSVYTLENLQFETFLVLITDKSDLSFIDIVFQARNL